jgi:hypothetical protein
MPFGLDAISRGTKEFFLVCGGLNQQLVANCAQPCIGIEQWHSAYAALPAFQAVEKIWVLLNLAEPIEANREFVWSIAQNIWVRERCVITRETISTVCGGRLRMLRKKRYQYESDEMLTRGFDEIYKFQSVPLPTHADKLAELLAPPPELEKPSVFGGWGDSSDWRSGGSGATGTHSAFSNPVEVPSDDSDDPLRSAGGLLGS